MNTEITTIIHSYNAESVLDCVESALLLSPHVIIVGEETRELVKEKLLKLKIDVVSISNTGIVETSREFGISQTKTDWVFLLDVDEKLTEVLAEEIKAAVKSEKYSYYKIPRKEIVFHKKWLQHGGWWPNYQIRLINKQFFDSWPQKIHSTPIIKGDFTFLNSPLLHYSQNNLTEVVSRTVIFEDKESDLLFEAKRRVTTPIFFRKFFGELFRRLIKGLGFLDGEVGIIESVYQAFSKTITYLYLYEKSRSL